MDVIFPTGYNSSVYFERKDTIAYINEKMHCLAEDTDLFIVGGQSGIVIRDEGNLDNYNFTQIDFLYATMPDIVILCININDENEIIERTIKFIERAVGCKIVALVAYPIFYEEEDIYKQRKAEMNIERFQLYKKKLEKKFALSVFLLSNSVDINKLVTTIIDRFSE